MVNQLACLRYSLALGLMVVGLLACVPTAATRSIAASPSGSTALAAATVDQTATAASATIAAALGPTPPATPIVLADVTKTAEAQLLATAVAATQIALLSATPTANRDATATRESQRMATAVAQTLTAQPTATLTATPTPDRGATQTAVAHDVAASVAATLAAQAPPALSAAHSGTRQLVFTYGDIGDSDLRVIDVETGRVNIIAGQACDEAEPSWSPDNTQLVYHADCAESYDIYRVNSAGGASTRLTFTPDLDEREPEYAPDGRQIIYRVNPRKESETNAVGELWVMTSDGNNAQSMGLIGRAPAWSPDGTKLAFMSDRTGRWNIYLYDFATRRTTQLTTCDTNCRWPAWSADGQALVFNTTTKATSTEAEALWIIPAIGGPATKLITGHKPGRPSWSRTGLIAFNSTDGIEYMQVDGRERVLLIPNNLNWAPHWSK
ncbi:MAG: PD40 domain-containing protein [Caldilineaceae bacterium]|nr:PD40 domain-containing protein [Caldilineaceae bacterium]